MSSAEKTDGPIVIMKHQGRRLFVEWVGWGCGGTGQKADALLLHKLCSNPTMGLFLWLRHSKCKMRKQPSAHNLSSLKWKDPAIAINPANQCD